MDKWHERALINLQYVWPRAAVLQVIQLWKENECLYNTKHKLYHSKRGRYNALVKMANALRKYYPEITPAEVKCKITYLRSQYARELSRIKEKSGRPDCDEYVPTAYWYSDMNFLNEFMRKEKRVTKSRRRNTRFEDDSCESIPKIECDESLTQDYKRSRLESYTPVMHQENPILLPRNSTPLYKVSLPYSTSGENYVNDRDEAFCNYIKMELSEIKNKIVKDDLIEKIMLAFLDAKKKQNLLRNNDLENCFETV